MFQSSAIDDKNNECIRVVVLDLADGTDVCGCGGLHHWMIKAFSPGLVSITYVSTDAGEKPQDGSDVLWPRVQSTLSFRP